MSTALEVLLMDAEWRRGAEESLLLSLLAPGSRTGAPQAVIAKFATTSAIPEWVAADERPWDMSKVERNRPELAKYLSRFSVLEKWVQPTSGNHWDKLSTLVVFMEERMRQDVPELPGSAIQLVQLLEVFAQSREHWLKVAGGAKAEVLSHTLKARSWHDFEVVLECGTFIGYTASRLAAEMWRMRGGLPRSVACVATIELDPVQACIARHFLDLAGLSALVEVLIGQVRDVIPRVTESFGARSMGLAFMDYKGTIFHTDLELLEHVGAVATRGTVVADNVALPGAPLLLWRLAFGPSWALKAYAMMEFHEPNTEDWMAVGDYAGPSGDPGPPPPASWRRLSWHTDHMRRRACGLRPTEGDMFEADRVAYSRHVRRHFLAAGVEAVPWIGPRDGDESE